MFALLLLCNIFKPNVQNILLFHWVMGKNKTFPFTRFSDPIYPKRIGWLKQIRTIATPAVDYFASLLYERAVSSLLKDIKISYLCKKLVFSLTVKRLSNNPDKAEWIERAQYELRIHVRRYPQYMWKLCTLWCQVCLFYIGYEMYYI